MQRESFLKHGEKWLSKSIAKQTEYRLIQKRARILEGRERKTLYYVEIRNGKRKPRLNELIILLHEKIKPDYNECVHWLGVKNKCGYGQVSWKGKITLAHRVSLELKLGRLIHKNMETLHSCDSRDCYNPNHLREGTRQENIQEAVLKRKYKRKVVTKPE